MSAPPRIGTATTRTPYAPTRNAPSTGVPRSASSAASRTVSHATLNGADPKLAIGRPPSQAVSAVGIARRAEIRQHIPLEEGVRRARERIADQPRREAILERRDGRVGTGEPAHVALRELHATPRRRPPHDGSSAKRRHRRRREEPVATATRRDERTHRGDPQQRVPLRPPAGRHPDERRDDRREHRQRGRRGRVDAAASRQCRAATPCREHEERRRGEAQRYVPDQPERHAGSFGRRRDPARQGAHEIGSEHDAEDRDRRPDEARRTAPHAPHDEQRGEEQRRGRERQRRRVRRERASLAKEVHRRVEQARASRELAQRHDGDASEDDEHRANRRQRARPRGATPRRGAPRAR